MSAVEPEYLEQLSLSQRETLLAFISRADAIIGNYTFTAQTDAEILALSLRGAHILGYENDRLEELFRDEFWIVGVTEGLLAEWLAVVMRLDFERRILVAAGGLN